MPIDCDASYIVLCLDVQCDIMIIDNQALRLSHLLTLTLTRLIIPNSALSLLLHCLLLLILRPAARIALQTLINLLLHLHLLAGHVQALICKLAYIH